MKCEKNSNLVKILSGLACITMLFATATANAKGPKMLDDSNPNLDALTVVSTISQVGGSIGGFECADGSITGDPMTGCAGGTPAANILYPISGPVRAATIDPRTGETVGAVSEVGTINATPAFSTAFMALANEDGSGWVGTMPWTMNDFSLSIGDSTFVIMDNMPLGGTAFSGLGPVPQDSATHAALRMGGCAGIAEVNGTGPYANKIGTLCLNGTFNFDGTDPYWTGEGVSNCTLVLHTPAVME